MVGANGFKVVDEAGVERVGGDGGAVADDEQLAPSAGERHVHAARSCQEADFALHIGTHQRNDDSLFFTSLEAIDGTDFDAFWQLFAQELDLGGVGGDDGDMVGGDIGVEKLLHLFDDERCFFWIAEAVAVGGLHLPG